MFVDSLRRLWARLNIDGLAADATLYVFRLFALAFFIDLHVG